MKPILAVFGAATNAGMIEVGDGGATYWPVAAGRAPATVVAHPGGVVIVVASDGPMTTERSAEVLEIWAASMIATEFPDWPSPTIESVRPLLIRLVAWGPPIQPHPVPRAV